MLTFVGALAGTLGVRQIGPHTLKVAIPLLLIAAPCAQDHNRNWSYNR